MSELSALSSWTEWLAFYPELVTAATLVLLVTVAWAANWVVKHLLVRSFYRFLQQTVANNGVDVKQYGVIQRLSNVVPALVLSSGITLVSGVPDALVSIVRNVCSAFIIMTVALAIGRALNIINAIYGRRPEAASRPIKGYLQVIKIFVYVVGAILIISALIDRSPLILLSGLGAMAAVLMLIFQDTLLSLVASVQISSSGIIRVGDWIEMPQLNADGDIIDIALHTVTVQNWDKTVTVIPTKRFISDSFKNWRGMSESGGRRIKRSLYIDQNSIRFLSPEELQRLGQFMLLDDYMSHKNREIADWNSKLTGYGKDPVNTRRATNIGTFRAYIEQYLRHHPSIRKDMTLIVRQLNPSAEGLPLELYCFSSDTRWAFYEGIQSDIFDHLLAILPEFGLSVFQHPGGMDMRQMLSEARTGRLR